MRNTIKKGKVHILIMSVDKNRYIGLCKEFGFIEEGETMGKVERRLINSIFLLLKTVKERPELESSLNLGLPIRYRLLFYIVPFFAWLSSFINLFNTNIRYFSQDISCINHA